MKNAITRATTLVLLVATFGASTARAAESAIEAQPSVAAAAAKARQLISAADFGALPFMVGPNLSPDARHIATAAHLNGKQVLTILQLGSKTLATHSFTMPGSWELRWYRWAGNDRVLVSVGE